VLRRFRRPWYRNVLPMGREPMPEITALLERVTQAYEAVHAREADLATARAELAEAVRAANAAGASLELLGRLLGLSRQRVSVIAKPR
jgi:predicted metal-dependent hydrolase